MRTRTRSHSLNSNVLYHQKSLRHVAQVLSPLLKVQPSELLHPHYLVYFLKCRVLASHLRPPRSPVLLNLSPRSIS